MAWCNSIFTLIINQLPFPDLCFSPHNILIKWTEFPWHYIIMCMFTLIKSANKLWNPWYKSHLSNKIVDHSDKVGASPISTAPTQLNTLRPRQNGRHFPDDIFKWIFLNENAWILINTSPKFVPRGPITNIPTLVQVMAWRRPGDKPLSKPMMARLPTHICVTQPQWVNTWLQWIGKEQLQDEMRTISVLRIGYLILEVLL